MLQLLHKIRNVSHPVQIPLPQLRRRLFEPARAEAFQLPADLLDLGFAVNQPKMIQKRAVGSLLKRVGHCGVQRDAEMPVVAHEAEGHQLDLRKCALLSKKLPELLFGDVVQDHFPVQRPGNQVRTDHGGIDGLEDAMRPHELCSFDAVVAIAQQKASKLRIR